MTAPQTFRSVDEQLTALRKGAAEIIPEEELRAKLERSRVSGKPLRVKLGVDPTAPDLHLGHTVVLRKLKHFQDEGHTAIFLIGGFTALVGDPTGQSETRPPLTPEQVQANAKTYLDQVFKLLDPEKTEVRNNADWLDPLTNREIVRLCARYRVARLLEREDFRSRLQKQEPIAVHELLYPLYQAYDSVALKADIELGATEQKFNLLMGRDIQREYGQESQVALTMPILVGTDGQRKMSKSLGNYVGITESPTQMFGKIMSISDELMWSYYELLTDFGPPVIVRVKEEVRTGVLHPKKAKIRLAHTIVAEFHGESVATKAADEFESIFREGESPTEIAEYRLQRVAGGTVLIEKKIGDIIELTRQLLTPLTPRQKWAKLLVILEEVPSRSEADRLIKQRAVEINDRTVADVGAEIDFSKPATYNIRVGKRNFFRIVIKE
jgi:tyrosyl-tRNA synthetase